MVVPPPVVSVDSCDPLKFRAPLVAAPASPNVIPPLPFPEMLVPPVEDTVAVDAPAVGLLALMLKSPFATGVVITSEPVVEYEEPFFKFSVGVEMMVLPVLLT